MGNEFLVEFYSEELLRQPLNDAARVELAHLLTRLGRYSEGLAHDQELVRRHPLDPICRYNLACSLALLAQRDAAFEALEQALSLGYRDAAALQEDPDLASLRADPRFQSLLERMGPA